MITRIIIFILILFPGVRANALPNDSINYDFDSEIEIRTSDNINQYLEDNDFIYDSIVPPKTESILEKLLNWLGNLFNFIESGGKPVSYLFYLAVILILSFALLKLFGVKYQSLIIRKKGTYSSLLEVFNEDIQSLQFNTLIEEAIAAENYSLAIRYLYLKFLKTLADNQLIEWEINKTNKEYAKEIKKTTYYTDFKNLTRVYEYVWYGEFKIDKMKFQTYENRFQKVFNKN